MNLSEFAIDQLKTIVAGEHELTKTQYKTGRDLVDFFNSFGERDTYDQVFNDPSNRFYSRPLFVVDKLKKLNGTKSIKNIIEKIVNDDNNDKRVVADKLNEIIKPDNYFLEEIDGTYTVISQDNYDEDIKIEASFEENQTKIVEEISKAKFIIWVAVAWFTDDVLFRKLIEKKKQGINVQVIIIDDDINSTLNFEEHFEIYRIPKTPKFANMMHHKFCVIDLCTVINGSYNWTKKAQFNCENITIFNSRQLAEEFANEFICLKSLKN
ncbi:hypothetical protein Cylst_2980 [Cylindrospermum stagnale PCC 7417]|uniref:phospholipase D n=1 Tax=Cylindrospermum stagnale PCC 7417 TaxID=56107 RepID=K9WZD0_9NOST|nr:phospholipase D-like domain-containing protein [Cylindrospermum stagnale]AFZ25151.1 hypothetical protein Cylst_2980 [Cylindrospermum stagnale PCC 7417]